MSFNTGSKVVYNPNIDGLVSAIERPWDIGTVVSTDDNYALVYFPLNGYVGRILFRALSLTELDLPSSDHNQEEAVAEFWKRRKNKENWKQGLPSLIILS